VPHCVVIDDVRLDFAFSITGDSSREYDQEQAFPSHRVRIFTVTRPYPGFGEPDLVDISAYNDFIESVKNARLKKQLQHHRSYP
jgi:hypothetical protein